MGYFNLHLVYQKLLELKEKGLLSDLVQNCRIVIKENENCRRLEKKYKELLFIGDEKIYVFDLISPEATKVEIENFLNVKLTDQQYLVLQEYHKSLTTLLQADEIVSRNEHGCIVSILIDFGLVLGMKF